MNGKCERRKRGEREIEWGGEGEDGREEIIEGSGEREGEGKSGRGGG